MNWLKKKFFDMYHEFILIEFILLLLQLRRWCLNRENHLHLHLGISCITCHSPIQFHFFLDIKFLLVPLLNFKSSGKVQKSEVWGSGKHKLLSHYIVVLSHMGHGTKICKFHLISFFHFNYIERNLSEEMWDLRTILLRNFSTRRNDKPLNSCFFWIIPLYILIWEIDNW